MAERLTMTSDKGGLAFTFDLDITCGPSEMQKIVKLAEKLKHYEDLEEQGRLIELPNNISLDVLIEELCNYQSGCPSNLGLKENCKLSCEQCWIAALKGEKE